jgi:hypothetical protein
MDKLKSIIFIQLRYKFIFKIRNRVSVYYEDIHNHIQTIMNRNENSFQLKLISNYIYNSVNTELYKLIEKYDNIKIEGNIFKNIVILDKLKLELKTIIQKVGTKSFNDINFYYIDDTFKHPEILEQMDILNKYFTPTKVFLYNKKIKVNEYDNSKLNSTKILLFSKIKKKNITLFEYINGAIIYLKYNSDILIITGYFNKDPLNLIRNTGLLKKKYDELIENIIPLNIDNNFKYNYLDQLSLCDLFILSSDEILDKIQTDYFKIINYKKNNISYIVKDFLNKNIKEQLEIIVLFLLIENNDIQYMAYLLYDLINNDSYLLKSQPLSDQIFNNLHWSLQKNFKGNVTKIEENKNMNFKIEEIPYEKRIYLMNCDDFIKQKATDKYKEIINKSNDNSSKSQQYLDSILKIPFNVYKKEEILNLKDTYELKIRNIVTIINQYIKNNNINISNFPIKKTMLYSEMVDCINKLIEFNNLNNNILELFIKKNKNSELKSIIDSINNSQTIIKYKNKGNKNEYLEIFQDFFNNNDIDSNIKSKFYTIINIKLNPINNKINTIINEWTIFKQKRKDYIVNIDKCLNNAIYSQNDAKKEIKRIIGQWINGKMTGYCLGFEGPPGIGKTSLAKQGIAKCLIDDKGNSRPFSFIAVGGSSNGSLLEGHNYTYVGSNYGKIIEILIQTQCMNPIIYIDELDKISNTENGKEIVGILTHMTDSTQNEHFNDKYFSGINFDLSKVLFIFSYNDYSKIDPILADRIHRIKFNYLQTHEKINIMQKYIIPELLNTIGYSNDSIKFSDEVIEYIITNYTYEAGVRKIKEKVYEIIREINLEEIMDNSTNTKNISIEFVKKIFANKPQHNHKKISDEDLVGIVNGLYATSLGLGGIIEIQVTKTYSETKMGITITGQQGDVMKESIQCAKTIAWNMLPDEIKNKIKEDKTFGGLHLHCPEAATPKDGPSAGGAITLAIISLLTNIKVKQTIGLTGEIDLKGNITKIGGLDLKIEGGKAAGLKTILIPEENRIDYDIIKLEKPNILENIEIIFVKTIDTIIKLSLHNNDIIFG